MSHFCAARLLTDRTTTVSVSVFQPACVLSVRLPVRITVNVALRRLTPITSVQAVVPDC